MSQEELMKRVQRQAWMHKYPLALPFLLFLIASITTAVSVLAIERAGDQTRAVEMDRNLTEISSALQRRVMENVALVRAGSALVASHGPVAHSSFVEFARDLQGPGTLYGSMGMGWAPYVPVDELKRFEAEIRQNFRSDYKVYPRPEPGREYLVPILYLEPGLPQNQKAIGFDMASERVRRDALELAIKEKSPSATGNIHLIQDGGNPNKAGFIIYMPVFVQSGAREKLKGFVYSPFRVQDFLASASQLYQIDSMDIAIYDQAIDTKKLLAEHRVTGLGGATLARSIDMGGIEWVVTVQEKRSGKLSALAWVTLIFGAVAALLVMFIGWLIVKRESDYRLALERLTSEASIRNSLTRELNHRVKNTLANVLSIAALTRRRSKDLDEFADSLTARIRALSATHDLLAQSDWRSASLGEIVRAEMAPYMDGHEGHVRIEGPEIKLAPSDAMSLGLAIHELATNAAKYGALSVIEGCVFVAWELLQPDLAQVYWREAGGPSVAMPTKRGFGRDLIEKIVAHELKSSVDLQFNEGGVECRLQVPVRALPNFTLKEKWQKASGLGALTNHISQS